MTRRQIQGLVALILVVVAGWLGGYYAPKWLRSNPKEESAPAPTGDPHVDDFRHLGWLLRTKWSWLEMREEQGLDLDALEEEALAICRAEPGDRGFLRGLTRYMSGIRDGHGHVELAGVNLDEERRWPFSLIEVEEGVMVDGIAPAIFRSKALKRGDIILAVDDEPIDAVIRAKERFIIAATPATRRQEAIFALTQWSGRETLRVRALPMGETDPVTVEVPCVLPGEPVPRLSWQPRKKQHYRELDRDTAYFCVPSFSPGSPGFKTADPETKQQIVAPEHDAYARAFEKICSKSALVLDLRRNGGGTDLIGQALALHLMEPGFHYLRLAGRRGGRWTLSGWQDPIVGRGTPRFVGRLVCLIDEGCLSVTDNVACSLRDEHPNVIFVGQPTGGGSGAPRTFVLPATKARVTFCTLRVYAPNGTATEGTGVTPNIAVRATRAQMLAGEDAVLQAALATLNK